MKRNPLNSIKFSIPVMCILPVFLLGAVMTFVCSLRFADVMHEQTENELKNIAEGVLLSYDTLYPGEYYPVINGNVVAFYKGEKEITGEYEMLDAVKKQMDVDVTFFYKDTRMITTIKDASGKPIIATGANTVICRDVLEEKKACFYRKMEIDTGKYLGYYCPLLNEKGDCVGMLAVCRSSETVHHTIRDALLPNILLIVLTMGVAGSISVLYSRNLVKAFEGVRRSLKNVEEGKLNKDVPRSVIVRGDELSDMGKSVQGMQKALRLYIERDTLTTLYNRRYVNMKLKELIEAGEEKGEQFCVALGDIDYFKKVNDTYGHDIGDLVLEKIGSLLKKHFSGKNFVARWGGEEFLIVWRECVLDDALHSLENFRDVLNKQVIEDEKSNVKLQITMTFGIAQALKGEDQRTIIGKVDELLYKGKESGRNRIIAEGKETA